MSGIRIDIKRNSMLLRKLAHQFHPYQDVFGCRVTEGQPYPGTLFRSVSAAASQTVSRTQASLQVSLVLMQLVHVYVCQIAATNREAGSMQ